MCWKQGQVMWEEYRNVSCHCRRKTGVAKAQLELKLDGNMGGNNKGFFKIG